MNIQLNNNLILQQYLQCYNTYNATLTLTFQNISLHTNITRNSGRNYPDQARLTNNTIITIT